MNSPSHTARQATGCDDEDDGNRRQRATKLTMIAAARQATKSTTMANLQRATNLTMMASAEAIYTNRRNRLRGVHATLLVGRALDRLVSHPKLHARTIHLLMMLDPFVPDGIAGGGRGGWRNYITEA